MALSDPWGHDGKTYDGKEMRQIVEMLAGHNGIAQTSGVLFGCKVSQQTSPATTVRMAAGGVLIGATGSGLFGAYGLANDASLTSPAFTATSANGRWDYLILRVTSGVAALEIVAGTAAGSPVAPTITGDNYLALALVKLPASTTNITDAMITDARVFTGKWASSWGIMSTMQGTANVTGNSPTAADIITTPSLTFVANRLIRVDYSTMLALTSGAGALNALELVRDTTVLNSWQHYISPGGAGNNEHFDVHYVSGGTTAGAHTFKVRWASNVSSAGVDSATSTYKRAFTVADDGPFANPD